MSYQKLLQQMIGVTLVALFLVGCGAPAATPVDGTYHWRGDGTPTLFFGFKITDEGSRVEDAMAGVDFLEAITVSAPRETALRGGSFEFIFSLPTRYVSGMTVDNADVVFKGKFVTPTQVEGTYQSKSAVFGSGEWSAELSE